MLILGVTSGYLNGTQFSEAHGLLYTQFAVVNLGYFLDLV